jgi:anti-sigma factor RsiW
MWTCWFAMRALTAYQDGELAPGKARWLAHHLRACAPCAGELAELQSVTLLIRSLPDPVRPGEYWLQALQSLRGRMQGGPWSPRPSVVELFVGMLDSPMRAMAPVALVGVALVNTVIFLGVEDEALTFVASYLLPIILD